MVVRPGRQGEKQVARLSDTAVPRAGQAALEEHRAVTSSWGGEGKQCATQGLPGRIRAHLLPPGHEATWPLFVPRSRA